MKKKHKKRNKHFMDDNFEAYRKIRKPMPPPSRVIKSKEEYDRRDRSWLNDIDGNEDE